MAIELRDVPGEYPIITAVSDEVVTDEDLEEYIRILDSDIKVHRPYILITDFTASSGLTARQRNMISASLRTNRAFAESNCYGSIIVADKWHHRMTLQAIFMVFKPSNVPFFVESTFMKAMERAHRQKALWEQGLPPGVAA